MSLPWKPDTLCPANAAYLVPRRSAPPHPRLLCVEFTRQAVQRKRGVHPPDPPLLLFFLSILKPYIYPVRRRSPASGNRKVTHFLNASATGTGRSRSKRKAIPGADACLAKDTPTPGSPLTRKLHTVYSSRARRRRNRRSPPAGSGRSRVNSTVSTLRPMARPEAGKHAEDRTPHWRTDRPRVNPTQSTPRTEPGRLAPQSPARRWA